MTRLMRPFALVVEAAHEAEREAHATRFANILATWPRSNLDLPETRVMTPDEVRGWGEGF